MTYLKSDRISMDTMMTSLMKKKPGRIKISIRCYYYFVCFWTVVESLQTGETGDTSTGGITPLFFKQYFPSSIGYDRHDLPDSIRSSDSFTSFKNNLKIYLFNQVFTS